MKATADNLGRLDSLLESARSLSITDQSKIVILSDFHMGDGRRNDDFLTNGAIVLDALKNYYLPHGYLLILNGDIEEYLRAKPEDIRRAWEEIFRIFDRFAAAGKLVRLVGNHEIHPAVDSFVEVAKPFTDEAVLLQHPEGRMFVFHGHQAGSWNTGGLNRMIGFFLRCFANPLKISNYSVAGHSQKQFAVEKKVYEFSRQRGLVSIIGHTHRPLFESLSKQEENVVHFERLCRLYSRAGKGSRDKILAAAQKLNQSRRAEVPKNTLASSVYGEIVHPCLFNSGCAVGKRGFTGLEIKKGKIFLVFWSDKTRAARYSEFNEYKRPGLWGSALRVILRRENLSYVFARNKLLDASSNPD